MQLKQLISKEDMHYVDADNYNQQSFNINFNHLAVFYNHPCCIIIQLQLVGNLAAFSIFIVEKQVDVVLLLKDQALCS